MLLKDSLIYRLARRILGTALGFYFSRIERFHRERPAVVYFQPPELGHGRLFHRQFGSAQG